MTRQQAEVVEKRRFLRQEYGGLMSLKNLAHELGLRDARAAKRWAYTHKVRAVRMPKQGGQECVKYDTDHVAKILMSLAHPADEL
jgi:hypothetical protein